MHTKDLLAHELTKANLPEMAAKAATGYYHVSCQTIRGFLNRFRLRLQYALRDPEDVIANRELLRLIDELDGAA